ncbi:uncharacterized protein LOC107263199 isoform X3 [Cephus cinctus]|uniref:Uncharacterized protein LOC107263199 isoform X3 n=1 Tax=Cephus cinctus TaxID=211228 RepID=A0AAJ7BGU4_CEPCN|nr:uncharacterized protein LOC107263199 isoform X3 [Cephus cinctus]
MYKFLLPICLWAIATSVALPAAGKTASENDLMASIYSDCLKKESIGCIKYKLFAFVDKMLADKEDIALSEGITVVRTSSKTEEGAPRSLDATDPTTDVDALIFDRVGRFLRTHTIKVDLKGTDILGAIESTGRSLEDLTDSVVEGRGKKKKAAKILGPILLAVALKAAALLPLALGAIAFIAGKALLIGKIALLISAIIGLKKLLGSQQKHVTYEVVSHPHHSSSHVVSHDEGIGHGGFAGGSGGIGSDYGVGYSSGAGAAGGSAGGHGSSGWARSSHELAYSAYKPSSL